MAMTSADRLRDYILQHQLWLNRITNQQVKEANRLLLQMEREIFKKLRSRIRRALEVGKEAGPDTRDHLLAILSETDRIMRGPNGMPRVRAKMEASLSELAEYEANFSMSMLKKSLPASVLASGAALHRPPAPFLAAMIQQSPFNGHTIKKHFQNLAKSHQKALKRVVEAGVLSGDPLALMERNLIRAVSGFRKSKTLALVQQSVSHVHQTARLQTFQANAAKGGVVKGLMWLSTLDMRTTMDCIVRDQQLYTLSYEPIGHPYEWGAGPGLFHFGCRSTATAVLKSFAELGLTGKDMPKGARASMDGAVPSTTTAKDFFKRALKDPARRAELEKVHGIERIRRLEAGEMTIEQMVKPAGGVLRLDQMPGIEGPGGLAAPSATISTQAINAAPTFKTATEAAEWLKANHFREVNLPGATISQLQEMADGVESVMHGRGNRMARLEWMPKKGRGKALGYFSMLGDDAIVQIRKSVAKDLGKANASLTAERWATKMSQELAAIDRRLADASYPDFLREKAIKRKELLRGIKRWTANQDADRPLMTLISHETGHGLMYLGTDKAGFTIREAWEKALSYAHHEARKAGKNLNALGVSEYGASSDAELWAEITAMIASGRRHLIPTELLKIYETVLDDYVGNLAGA